jgi:hypothetical protein
LRTGSPSPGNESGEYAHSFHRMVHIVLEQRLLDSSSEGRLAAFTPESDFVVLSVYLVEHQHKHHPLCRPTVEKWITADAPKGHRDWNQGGTYRSSSASDLEYDPDHNFKLNSWSYDYPRFAKPLFHRWRSLWSGAGRPQCRAQVVRHAH